jgi:hypothetical protein
LAKAGIDYFLDEENATLQTAVQAKDANAITENIKEGIRNSSHMLCVVSERTYQSNWVPFEVGYGHAAIIDKAMALNTKDKKLKLSVLTLQDLSEKPLPEFMHVAYIVRGTKSLNEYIAKLLGKGSGRLILENRLFSHSKEGHSLDNILNWKL